MVVGNRPAPANKVDDGKILRHSPLEKIRFPNGQHGDGTSSVMPLRPLRQQKDKRAVTISNPSLIPPAGASELSPSRKSLILWWLFDRIFPTALRIADHGAGRHKSCAWRHNAPDGGMDRQPTTSACGWEQLPRYLIGDRDACYGDIFVRRVRSLGIRDHPTSARSPWQNGYAERLIGSIRRECLDHIVVIGEQHLRHVLMCYMSTTTPSERISH